MKTLRDPWTWVLIVGWFLLFSAAEGTGETVLVVLGAVLITLATNMRET